jgi:IclR family transcriptional regulator, pca regulon regulatory protein
MAHLSQSANARSAAISPAEDLERWVGDARFMQSLARGLLALGAVARGKGHPVSAGQVAAVTGLSLAAARRCLYTLHAIGYVRANRNGAVPGPALAHLAVDYAGSAPLISGCGPVLDALHEQLQTTTSLAMFEGKQPIIVASSAAESLLRLGLPIGASIPVHCTSAGKVYLASFPQDVLELRLHGLKLTPYTEHTMTSVEELKDAVVEVRRRGYAITDQEFVLGVRSAAAPVQDARGNVIASVNATMLAAAVGLRELRSKVIPALIRAASELSRMTP